MTRNFRMRGVIDPITVGFVLALLGAVAGLHLGNTETKAPAAAAQSTPEGTIGKTAAAS